jgi:hypothetical protein
VQVALLLVGYAVGLSVWASLAVWVLRRVFVAGRWSVRSVAARTARVSAATATPAAEPAIAQVVPLPTAFPAHAPIFDGRRAA